MNGAKNPCAIVFLVILMLCQQITQAQQPTPAGSDYVTDTVRPVVSRFAGLKFGGYIQPQYQIAQKKGIASYEGGNFQKNTDNRFMVRRARLKSEYQLLSKNGLEKKGLFSLQMEVTERGVNIIDAFARWYVAPQFSVTAGMMDHPYGNEVLTSSSNMESPERGRASQILLPGEKDLGAMVSFEPKGTIWEYFKLDAGFFNGQGYSGPTDFDSFKDLNVRLSMKPLLVDVNQTLSGGLSALYGGWVQENRHRYHMEGYMGNKSFVDDSSLNNMGSKAPREYLGFDAQYVWKHRRGKTELRGEYWKGVQSGTSATTVSPGTLPTDPVFVREFDAAFFYLVHSVLDNKWEVVLKYDWYDPNKEVSGEAITPTGNFTRADIKYNTLGLGLTHYITPNLKILCYYAMVNNESTSLNGYTSDVEDNVFTLRMQVKF